MLSQQPTRIKNSEKFFATNGPFSRGRSHILFYTVCVENDTTDLAVDLWDKRPEFTDVVFVVGDREFHAHKMVLASESEYFKSLLYGKMKEATLKKIRLSKDNVTPDAFEKILQFVYKKSLDITEPLEVYYIATLSSVFNTFIYIFDGT